MAIKRREFLKIAGLSVAAGLGGFSAFTGLRSGILEASQYVRDPKELKASRWGLVIDMSKLNQEDIRRIMDVCHKKHNVPAIPNPKDEIKWIWPESFEHSFPGQESPYMGDAIKHQPYLVLCNHCDNPPCVRVCPTKATFKRADGIVMMDMHRCIGCRFCMAACPYGARSFNWRDPRPFIKEMNPEFPTRMKGVVEKCTFCYELLAVGKPPACVEHSNGGIVFGDLKDPNSEIRKIIATKFTIRRKPDLGTLPSVFYVVSDKENKGGHEHVG
ncbi:MAG: 4Fe-4S dicluster domain-containing protein [Thermodesulfovibrionales bacterium]|nr:4Fe-4S dicluster domain-containing protein [Thermodesulfovibrionales bacterium]